MLEGWGENGWVEHPLRGKREGGIGWGFVEGRPERGTTFQMWINKITNKKRKKKRKWSWDCLPKSELFYPLIKPDNVLILESRGYREYLYWMKMSSKSQTKQASEQNLNLKDQLTMKFYAHNSQFYGLKLPLHKQGSHRLCVCWRASLYTMPWNNYWKWFSVLYFPFLK